MGDSVLFEQANFANPGGRRTIARGSILAPTPTSAAMHAYSAHAELAKATTTLARTDRRSPSLWRTKSPASLKEVGGLGDA